MSMALEGVRAVDLSSGIAGPIAAMLLADFGADVVKIEPPDGDPGRALPGFAVWNRNKRSVVVDRDSAAGRRRMAELLAGADVCIVGEPRAALDGGPLDPDHLCSTYPALVVVQMPPYTLAEVPWAGGGLWTPRWPVRFATAETITTVAAMAATNVVGVRLRDDTS